MKNKIFRLSILMVLLVLFQSFTHNKTPKICFDKRTYDFGRIQQNSSAKCRFKFVNCGDEILYIHYVKTTCGCTDAHSDKRIYKPGESGYIEVSYDSRRLGNIGKIVFVATNSPGNEKELLRITGEVVKRTYNSYTQKK